MDDNDDDDDIERNQGVGSSGREGGFSRYEEDNVISHFRASMGGSQTREISPNDEMLQVPLSPRPPHYDDNYDGIIKEESN